MPVETSINSSDVPDAALAVGRATPAEVTPPAAPKPKTRQLASVPPTTFRFSNLLTLIVPLSSYYLILDYLLWRHVAAGDQCVVSCCEWGAEGVCPAATCVFGASPPFPGRSAR